MRFMKSTFVLLILLLLTSSINENVSASSVGFSMEQLSDAYKNAVIQNTNITRISEEPPKKAIVCFDVNESGIIAIGCGDFQNKTVCIYSANGIFQYGYEFHSSGDFGVELDNERLIIYFVRSDVAIFLSAVGEIEEIAAIPKSANNNSYWNHYVFSTKRQVGQDEYIIDNDIGIFSVFALSYSRLIRINEEGVEEVIYDVSSFQFSRYIVITIMISTFVCIVTTGLWCYIKNSFKMYSRAEDDSVS